MSLEGSVQVTGWLGPTSSGDTFPTHVALYGKDGLRNVETELLRNEIPLLRREIGMVVGIQDTDDYWRLAINPTGDTTSNSDWEIFLSSSGYTDTFISGTTFDNGSFMLTLHRNDGVNFQESLAILASDVYVLSGVYNPSGGLNWWYIRC